MTGLLDLALLDLGEGLLEATRLVLSGEAAPEKSTEMFPGDLDLGLRDEDSGEAEGDCCLALACAMVASNHPSGTSTFCISPFSSLNRSETLSN